MALGRNGDQTLLSWRERVLISLVTKDFLRRIFTVPAGSGEGRLTEPTAAAQPWRRERVLMPPHPPFAIPVGIGSVGWKASFFDRVRFVNFDNQMVNRCKNFVTNQLDYA